MGSVAGTRYPPLPSSRADTDSDPASMLSPQSKARALKTHSKAPSRAGSKAPSAMSPRSPITGFGGEGNFQPFAFGEAPMKAQSQRPDRSVKAPSEFAYADGGRAPSTIGDDYVHVANANALNDHRSERASAYGGDGLLDGGMSGRRSNAAPSVAGSARTARTGASQRPPAAGHSRRVSGDTQRSRALSPVSARRSAIGNAEEHGTPTQSRAHSPDGLTEYESGLVRDLLSSRTPRTSIAPSALEAALKKSHFHDQDLCILLHAAEDDMQHEVVKKAVRKAVAARIKKLGMKHDQEVRITSLF